MTFDPHIEFADKLDQKDPLKEFRSRFHIPVKDGKEVIYLCGNSLGLQPKKVSKFINEELDDWANLGVEGHFSATRPWVDYHLNTKKSLSRLTGSKFTEVVSMGSLTENLHLLLDTFYRPEGEKTKILIEEKAFPSDYYAVYSQLKQKGYSEDHLISIKPDQGLIFSNNHLIQSINAYKGELALVLLPGIQYFTGQLIDIATIAQQTKQNDIILGLDLAHAIGNVPLTLHDDEVDFATWCSYKYLNSGPGGISGIFVHEKHHQSDEQLKGWWGHERASRFIMDNKWKPAEGVDAWQLSNPNILALAAHLASLEIFEEAGMKSIRTKSIQLTGYLEYLLLNSEVANRIELITPKEPAARGAQLSIKIKGIGKELVDELGDRVVILDYREPDIIRVAPSPLYNTYAEVWSFMQILVKVLRSRE